MFWKWSKVRNHNSNYWTYNMCKCQYHTWLSWRRNWHPYQGYLEGRLLESPYCQLGSHWTWPWPCCNCALDQAGLSLSPQANVRREGKTKTKNWIMKNVWILSSNIKPPKRKKKSKQEEERNLLWKNRMCR